jgi:hypothetical protein
MRPGKDARLLRSRPGALNTPQPIRVEANAKGEPYRINGQPIEFIREEWKVVDRWWTDRPINRRYFEVFLESGKRFVVFFDNENQRWFTQQA